MKPLRIIHTADNHIGLRFTGRPYPDDLKSRLIDERFLALERIVALANSRSADLLVIAGDLFENTRVLAATVKRAAEILNGFSGVHVVILPGNHDFFEPGNDTLWGRFCDAMKENLIVLLSKQEPLSMLIGETDVVFYPGPCVSKHSTTNAIGWIEGESKNPAAINIGVAHGSVSGVSPDKDEKYYPMTPDDLRRAEVDFWLLGHTHLRYPSEPVTEGSLFYIPSTHTPDGFDCEHEGYIWCLDIHPGKKVIAESVRTGAFRFHEWQRTVDSQESIERLKKEIAALNPETTLLKLILSGRLSVEEINRLGELVSKIGLEFCYAEVYHDNVAQNIDRQYIDANFSRDSLPHRLLSAFAEKPEDNLVLQLAHELIKEART
jgi:DNA repair exonuclease SbcCD nuclease subunit